MAKTGVKLEDWEMIVKRGTNSASNIKEYKKLEFTTTDLTPFTKFNGLISEYNSSLSKLKSTFTTDSKKMVQVGKNKSDDDKAVAQK